MTAKPQPRADLGLSEIQRRYSSVSENAGLRQQNKEFPAHKSAISEHDGQRPVLPTEQRVPLLSVAELRQALISVCAASGGVQKWAAAHGVTERAVHMVIKGEREPGTKFLEALGLEVVYRRRK